MYQLAQVSLPIPEKSNLALPNISGQIMPIVNSIAIVILLIIILITIFKLYKGKRSKLSDNFFRNLLILIWCYLVLLIGITLIDIY